MTRFGVKGALLKDKLQDPDDVNFTHSKPRPSQIQRAPSWMDELGGRKLQTSKKRKAHVIPPARMKKKQCRQVQITQFDESAPLTQVGPVIPGQRNSGLNKKENRIVPRFGAAKRLLKPGIPSMANANASMSTMFYPKVTEVPPRKGPAQMHPKHNVQNSTIDPRKFTETKRNLAIEKKKSRNLYRKAEKLKIELKKWQARVTRLTKEKNRLYEKKAQSSSVRAIELSYNKVCRQLQNEEKEKTALLLQVNNLQDEAEDLRKENTYKTKEVISKEKTIAELQNKLNLQKKKESKPSVLLQTPAKPKKIGFNKMSIRHAQQSAQRMMFFHSIMKDALPERVKQLQANQWKRRRIQRGEGSPPRGTILKGDMVDWVEHKVYDLMFHLWSRPQYKIITESLLEAFSALKLSLNPHSLLVFLDGLIWHPGMDLACTEEALILLRHLLEGDSSGTTAFSLLGYVPPCNRSKDSIPLSLRGAFRSRGKKCSISSELGTVGAFQLTSPQKSLRQKMEVCSISPGKKKSKTDSNTCPMFYRLLELFKWMVPNKIHNLTRSFPKPPKKPPPIPKDYDERQELVKALACKKRKLRHQVLQILYCCLQQTLPQEHGNQIAMVCDSQDSFLTLFDHEDVTNEPRDELLRDQTIALRIFVIILSTPTSVKDFCRKVVELPIRRPKTKDKKKIHSSYAHCDSQGNATKTEGCTLIERIYDIFLHPHPELNPSGLVLFRLAAVDLMLHVKKLNCIQVLLKRKNPRSETNDFDEYIPFFTDLVSYFLNLFNHLHKERMVGKVVYKSNPRKLCTAIFEVIVNSCPLLQAEKVRLHSVSLKAMLTRLYLWNKSVEGWQMPEMFTNDADSLQALLNQDLRIE